MKKCAWFIALSLIFMIFITGCSEIPYSFKESVDEIDSIEIVSAENSLEFTVLKTLSETEQEKFLEQFKKIKFYHSIGDPISVYGKVIKINYKNGIYEMICRHSAEYVENGMIHYRFRNCDEGEFSELLNAFSD